MNSSFTDKLNQIKKLIDDDVYRKRVLLLCQQQEPKSFEEYSSSGSFRRLEKFESSTYSEVLRAIDLADNNKPVVMKIMRALTKGVIRMMPSVTTKGCQSYNDILNELVVSQALSQLHDGVILNGQPSALYKTHFFCLIHEIKVVSGNLRRTLSASKRRKSPKKSITIQAPEALTGTKVLPSSLTNNGAVGAPPAPASTEPKNGKQQPKPTDRTQDQKQTNNPTEQKQQPDKFEQQASQAQQKSEPPLPGNGILKMDSNKLGVSQLSTDMVENLPNSNEPAKSARDEELKNLPEEERMLMEALPHEYVVSVMRHDGQPLWWMMTHKKLSPQQLTSVLVQVIVGLAIAENVYLYEHRDLHVSNILIKATTSSLIPFTLDGQRYDILSHGIKATIIDATFSRLTHNGKVYYRDLTSTLRAYGTKKTPVKMSLQNRSYRQMVRLTKNKWEDFTPRTNLIWLTYLCETLMKNEIMKSDSALMAEIRKIRDHTLKVKTTYDLLACFPKTNGSVVTK
jgi:hypothetical protein